jgi:hypothetical protein
MMFGGAAQASPLPKAKALTAKASGRRLDAVKSWIKFMLLVI